MGLRYRLRQYRQAVTAEPLPQGDLQEIAGVLGDPAYALFLRFDTGDRRHSAQVYRLLRRSGHDNPDLLAAALLHDVGKTRVPLASWERALIVVAEKVWPRGVARWGQGAAQGWRRPFVVRCQHPQWGADLAEAVGLAPDTVALIRFHQDADLPTAQRHLHEQLGLLQWADDQC